MGETLEFGKDQLGLIIRTLKLLNPEEIVEVDGKFFSGYEPRLVTCGQLLREIKALLTLRGKTGQRLLELKVLFGTKVRLLSQSEQLEAKGERANLLLAGNQLFLQRLLKDKLGKGAV